MISLARKLPSMFLLFGLVVSTPNAHVEESGKLVFEMVKDYSDPIDGIAVSNVDGSGLRMLAARGGNPKWFPGGDKIAYYLTHKRGNGTYHSDPGDTWIIDLSGNLIKKIPYWVSDISADGMKLLVQKALHHPDSAWGATYELGIYDLSTDRYTGLFGPDQLPKELGPLTPISGKWFPDEQRILFQLEGLDWRSDYKPNLLGELILSDMQFKLHKIPVDELIMFGFKNNFDIAPDGNSVIFCAKSKVKHDQLSIYKWDFAGDTVNLIYRENGNMSTWEPVWSRDGKQIIFTSHLPDDLGSETTLKIMDANGENVRRVFPVGIIHRMLNGIGWAISERKTNADWWQPINGNKN